MHVNSYEMLLLSGVLSPACLEFRRVPDVAPPSTRSSQPELPNNLSDISVGAVSTLNQIKGKQDRESLTVGARFSLRSILAQIGIGHPTSQWSKHEPPPQQHSTAILEQKIQTLESLLKAAQVNANSLHNKIDKLQLEVKLMDELRANLAIEQESGKQLVQWLQEAEQQLADVHKRPCPPV